MMNHLRAMILFFQMTEKNYLTENIYKDFFQQRAFRNKIDWQKMELFSVLQ